MIEGEQPKCSMPQINSETGVSADYFNEFTTLRLSFLDGDKEKIIKTIKKWPIKKYQEVYPVNSFCNVITEKNKDAVNRLNQLAEKMNQFAKDEIFNDAEFVSIYNEILKLIYGSKSSAQIDIKDFGKG